MAVRLEVKLRALKGKKRKKSEVSTLALLNSGYETDLPEAVLPVNIAERLGFLPLLPKDTVLEEYFSVSGKFTARKIPRGIEISIGDKKVVAEAVISEFEREVLLSDATISEFEIVIEDAKKGEWRFKSD
jgi:hypothetical protein